AALWAARRLPDAEPLPLFAAAQASDVGEEPDARLPTLTLGAQVEADYLSTRLSLKGHPMGVLRPIFAKEGVAACAEAAAGPDGGFRRAAGVVLVRQRPGKGNAVFITLEDETGVLNVMMWARVFERFRREVMAARLLLVEGRLQKSPENVVHLMVDRAFDRTADLRRLSDDAGPPDGRAPIAAPPPPRGVSGHPRNVRILPPSRDFH
ncbi:OB-fold nucleic acid binding domain-containing protein, partial [Methylopila musalis]